MFSPRDVVFVFCMNQKAGVGLEGAVAASGLAIKNTRCCSQSADDQAKNPTQLNLDQIVVFLALIACPLKDFTLKLFEIKTSFLGWNRS